ncbi:MAG: hypothetical protein WCF24_07750 [Acidimicrobiales bacterium]
MSDESAGTVRELGAKVQDAVESLSAAAVEKVTRPILSIVRWTILAAVVAALAVFAFAAVVIGLVRLFDVEVFPQQVWATDFVVAGIFCGAGAFCWVFSVRKKKRGEGAG